MARSTSLRPTALSLPFLVLASCSLADAEPSYTYVSAEDIVRDHLPGPGAGIEFRNVESSGRPCYSLMSNGHSAGKVDESEGDGGDEWIRRMLRGAERNLDVDGGYALPDDGMVLVSKEGPLGASRASKETGELNSVVEGGAHDVCFVQFEFLCPKEKAFLSTTTVEVEYVFGSDEYYNDVRPNGTTNDDAFGIFLNGENIARVPDPDGDDPVTVRTVSESKHFVQNKGTYPDIGAGGFTTRLLARADTAPGWNKIRFAVGDAGDDELNSWAVIDAGSFGCGKKSVWDDTKGFIEEGLESVVKAEGNGKWGLPMPMAVACIVFLGLVAISLPVCAYGSTGCNMNGCNSGKGVEKK